MKKAAAGLTNKEVVESFVLPVKPFVKQQAEARSRSRDGMLPVDKLRAKLLQSRIQLEDYLKSESYQPKKTFGRLFKTIRLIWAFYMNFLWPSVILTAFCLRAFWVFGFDSFFGIFWCKVLTLGLTYYLINSNKKNEYYYFQNLGVTKTLLWAATISFDFILFLLLLILTYHLK